jgi:nitrogenase subunit NifH
MKNAPNGARLAGLIGNLRGLDQESSRLEKLATAIGTQVLHLIPHDPAVTEAELRKVPVVESNETCPASEAFRTLHDLITNLRPDKLTIPRPLPRHEFDSLFL